MALSSMKDILRESIVNNRAVKRFKTLWSPTAVLLDEQGNPVMGDVRDQPGAHTVLKRLQDLLTRISLAAGNAIIGKMKIVDDSGNVIGSLNNSLNVHTADAHRIPLNLHAINPSGTSETFGAGGASAGDSVFDVAAGQGGTFSPNDCIKISEGNTEEINTILIIGVAGDTLTVDRPLENDYTSAGVIEIGARDVSLANGSIGSPIVYEIAPPANKIYHINSILLHYEDGPQPGIELFSGIAGLTNGLVIRAETAADGNINLVVLRTNGDMKEYFGGNEVEFVQKVGGGDYATDAIWHMEEHSGAIIRLDGAQGDKLKFIYQDDVRNITEGENIVQGHIEG